MDIRVEEKYRGQGEWGERRERWETGGQGSGGYWKFILIYLKRNRSG
jgi:hypothetical protein